MTTLSSWLRRRSNPYFLTPLKHRISLHGLQYFLMASSPHVSRTHPPAERKRTLSARMAISRRDPSTEKHRRLDDVVMSRQSASVTDLSNPLALGRHSTFNLQSSQVSSRWCSRAGTGASSPQRGIRPCEMIAMLKRVAPSSWVRKVRIEGHPAYPGTRGWLFSLSETCSTSHLSGT
jgi:hypothetical protein